MRLIKSYDRMSTEQLQKYIEGERRQLLIVMERDDPEEYEWQGIYGARIIAAQAELDRRMLNIKTGEQQ